MQEFSATTIRGFPLRRLCLEEETGHLRVYRKICPSYIEEISDIHRTEPYVYSQMIAGADAPGFGEAKTVG